MKIVSKIYDGLLKAHSLLFEMPVSEYKMDCEYNTFL